MIFKRVCLLGLGLIGSSMALSMRRDSLVGTIAGYSRSDETLRVAEELGLADEYFNSPEDAVAGAELVVLCTPVGTFGRLAERIAPHLEAGTIVSDVGSVKTTVIRAIEPHLPSGVHFVPAHPLAGTEYSGPRAGFAELFDNRWCLLTVLDHTDGEAIERVAELWKGMGAHVDFMDPEHHDIVLAVTSHAPHLIAYTMVGVAEDLRRVTNFEVIKYSAAGFRDFTRIAASDPTMWRDIFLTNRDATLEVLGRFTEELFALQRAIRTGRGDQLFDYFSRTRAIRRGIIEAGQDTSVPNFGRRESEGE